MLYVNFISIKLEKENKIKNKTQLKKWISNWLTALVLNSHSNLACLFSINTHSGKEMIFLSWTPWTLKDRLFLASELCLALLSFTEKTSQSPEFLIPSLRQGIGVGAQLLPQGYLGPPRGKAAAPLPQQHICLVSRISGVSRLVLGSSLMPLLPPSML